MSVFITIFAIKNVINSEIFKKVLIIMVFIPKGNTGNHIILCPCVCGYLEGCKSGGIAYERFRMTVYLKIEACLFGV